MDRDRFAELLDASLQDFRQQLLDAFLEGPNNQDGQDGQSSPATSMSPVTPVMPLGPKEIEAGSAKDKDKDSALEASAWKKVERLFPSKERGVSVQTDHSDRNSNSVGKTSSLTPSEEVDLAPAPVFNARSSKYLRSGLIGVNTEEAMAIRHRLRVRLGALSSKTLVSGKSLLDAVAALGLTKYSEPEMNDMINVLADFVNLSFETEPADKSDGEMHEEDLEIFFFNRRDSRRGQAKDRRGSKPQSNFKQSCGGDVLTHGCCNFHDVKHPGHAKAFTSVLKINQKNEALRKSLHLKQVDSGLG